MSVKNKILLFYIIALILVDFHCNWIQRFINVFVQITYKTAKLFLHKKKKGSVHIFYTLLIGVQVINYVIFRSLANFISQTK